MHAHEVEWVGEDDRHADAQPRDKRERVARGIVVEDEALGEG